MATQSDNHWAAHDGLWGRYVRFALVVGATLSGCASPATRFRLPIDTNHGCPEPQARRLGVERFDMPFFPDLQAGDAHEPRSQRVWGYIRGSRDSVPVARASVVVVPTVPPYPWAQTDSAGRYSLRFVAEDGDSIRVEAIGYHQETYAASDVPADGRLDLELELSAICLD